MNQLLRRVRPDDSEEFGYQTRLACGDTASAVQICALHLFAREDELQPELSRLNSDILSNRHHGTALHAHLYDRPIPVSDAAMLTHLLATRILLTLTALVSVACLVGNTATFVLLGFGLPLSLVGAVGITALPLVVGHLAYEKIVAGHRGLQILLIAGVAVLCFGALLKLGEARRDMVDIAAATTATASYVDEPSAGAPPDPGSKPKEDSESRIHQTIGQAMLWFMIAADIALGLLVGLFIQKHTDEDYAAWKKLKQLNELVIALRQRIAELLSSIEVGKKRCTAGILRAQNIQAKRRPPYHHALSIFLVLILFAARAARAQTIERYEGILIDTSGSISRGGTTNELFHEYLILTKNLLLTEPPNSRVWVSSISTNSFGGVHEILKGWTPDVHGVFSDDLSHARIQLASSFDLKSSGMAPVESGTDIFGGLWHLKVVFESRPKLDSSPPVSKIIWIFSDMMNETKDFPMPELIELGSQRMLGRAKANGLVVPLKGYRVSIYGASTSGLTPQAWMTVKDFWTRYFGAAGAELVTYSGECDVAR